MQLIEGRAARDISKPQKAEIVENTEDKGRGWNFCAKFSEAQTEKVKRKEAKKRFSS